MIISVFSNLNNKGVSVLAVNVVNKLIVLRQHFHKQQAHLILIDKSNIQYYPQAL